MLEIMLGLKTTVIYIRRGIIHSLSHFPSY